MHSILVWFSFVLQLICLLWGCYLLVICCLEVLLCDSLGWLVCFVLDIFVDCDFVYFWFGCSVGCCGLAIVVVLLGCVLNVFSCYIGYLFSFLVLDLSGWVFDLIAFVCFVLGLYLCSLFSSVAVICVSFVLVWFACWFVVCFWLVFAVTCFSVCVCLPCWFDGFVTPLAVCWLGCLFGFD